MSNKWKDLSVEERNRYIKFAVSRGVTDLNRIKSIYEMPDVQEDIEHMKNPAAGFMQRAKDPDRKSVTVPFGHAAHKMGRASDSKGGHIYPLVQDTENGLIDFSYNPDYAHDRAVQAEDTLHLNRPEIFDEGYKAVFPNFYDEGGKKFTSLEDLMADSDARDFATDVYTDPSYLDPLKIPYKYEKTIDGIPVDTDPIVVQFDRYKYNKALPEFQFEHLKNRGNKISGSAQTMGEAHPDITYGLPLMLSGAGAAYQIAPRLTQAGLGALGAYSLASENGVRKTYNHLKNEEYTKGTLSALGDLLDLGFVGAGAKPSLSLFSDAKNIVKAGKSKYGFVPTKNSFTRGIGKEPGLEDLYKLGILRGNPKGTGLTPKNYDKIRFKGKDKDFWKPLLKKYPNLLNNYYNQTLTEKEWKALNKAIKNFEETPSNSVLKKVPAKLENKTYKEYLQNGEGHYQITWDEWHPQSEGNPPTYFYNDGRNPFGKTSYDYAKSKYAVRLNNASEYNPYIPVSHKHYSVKNPVTLNDPNLELFKRGPLGTTLKMNKETGNSLLFDDIKNYFTRPFVPKTPPKEILDDIIVAKQNVQNVIFGEENKKRALEVFKKTYPDKSLEDFEKVYEEYKKGREYLVSKSRLHFYDPIAYAKKHPFTGGVAEPYRLEAHFPLPYKGYIPFIYGYEKEALEHEIYHLADNLRRHDGTLEFIEFFDDLYRHSLPYLENLQLSTKGELVSEAIGYQSGVPYYLDPAESRERLYEALKTAWENNLNSYEELLEWYKNNKSKASSGLVDFVSFYEPKSAKEAFNNVVLNAAPYLLPTIGGLSNDNRKYNNGGYLNKYEEGGFEELYRQLHPNNPLPANRRYNGEYIPADMYEDVINLNTNTDYNYPYIFDDNDIYYPTPIITRSTEEPFVPNKSPELPVESPLQETFPTSNNTPYKDNELSPNKVLEEPDLSYLDELEKLQKTNPELTENPPLTLEGLSEVSNFNINDSLKTDINRYIPKDDSWNIEVPYNTSPVYFNQDELSPEELLEEPIVKPIINKKPVTKKPSTSNEELENIKFAIDNHKLDIPAEKDIESIKSDTPNSEEGEPVKNKYKEEVYKTPFVRTPEDDSYKRGHSLTNSQEAIVFHHTGYEDDPKGNKIKSQFLYDKKTGTSAHVVILKDGTRQIYASPDQVTFHAGHSKLGDRFSVNDFAIGIEFQGNTQKKPLTKKQIESAIEYIKPIIQKNNIPLENLINHTLVRKSFIDWYKQEKKKSPNIIVYDKNDTIPEKIDYKNDITNSEMARLLKAVKEQIYDKNPKK